MKPSDTFEVEEQSDLLDGSDRLDDAGGSIDLAAAENEMVKAPDNSDAVNPEVDADADAAVAVAAENPLTPRSYSASRGKRWAISWVLVLAIFGGIGYLIYRALDDASLFFLSVDRAVEQRESLGDRRFQLHGTPVPGTIEPSTGNVPTVSFVLAGEVAEVTVFHTGAPPDLFQECVPVVVQGRWRDAGAGGAAAAGSSESPGSAHVFLSNEILVKHDNNYTFTDAADAADAAGSDQSYDQTTGNHEDSTLARLAGCPSA